MAVKQTGMKILVYISASAFTNVAGAAKANVLGGQRNATLNRSAETIDATAKDTVGNWTETISGFKTWGVECEACYIADDTAYAALEKAFNDGAPIYVAVKFSSTNVQTGMATISDFPIELPYNDLATYSLTLSGNGELKKLTS